MTEIFYKETQRSGRIPYDSYSNLPLIYGGSNLIPSSLLGNHKLDDLSTSKQFLEDSSLILESSKYGTKLLTTHLTNFLKIKLVFFFSTFEKKIAKNKIHPFGHPFCFLFGRLEFFCYAI